MKLPSISSILAIAALGSCASATFTMSIAKSQGVKNIKKRSLSTRATITESLANNFTGGDYIAQVSVGTPPQTQTLAIDTGSSDVWLMSSTADLCTDPALQEEDGTGGCASTFDSSKSSSFKVVDANGFDISYADNSGAQGDYVTDDFTIGGSTIKALEMGLAYNVTLQTGLMGIGYDKNEASDSTDGDGFIYPSIIDQMMSQGLINTKSYSLYLNDYEASTGSIIFGGLDADKYHGKLLQVPIVPDEYSNGTQVYAEFSVAMTGFGITTNAGNTTNFTISSYQTPAILDSGTTLTYLPNRLVEDIYNAIGAEEDEDGNAYVDCSVRDNNPDMTFNFGFGGASGLTIAVPANELIFDLTGIFSTGGIDPGTGGSGGTCALGIMPGDSEESDGPYILGDVFLRSAYVVYDLQNNLIALAQTNFNSTTSSIVEFQASATTIPNVSGVASSAQVTETNTGILGGGGGPKTTSATGTATTDGSKTTSTSGTGTGASTSNTSKSAATGTVPAFDIKALFVLGISSVFTVLGASFILA
ncbi:acid protease [Mollisia scopiformis]|uniref:Acid protease n=1 Tax=Mollisia scopiformis TaxID=149040 RepID=A0A194X154_MOLSC|nr:acid protease [Mollisia scopiformis]KUJ13704.1 acid protease [Mollisia scopiformis]